MKKLLLTIFVSLMWFNISYAEVIFDKWKINENEAAVRVEKLGESDLSGAFTYALLKKNNKCDLMTIYFSSMSNGKYDLKELLGLKIPIKINGMGPLEAMIANTRPAFDAKTIATLDLSKEQIDKVKNLQNVTIQIGDPRPIDGYDFESVAEKIKIDFVKVDEFDPSEYFSNLSVTWDLSKNRAAVDKGRSMCNGYSDKKITSESNESVTVKTGGTNEKKYSLFGVFIGDDVNDYQPSNKDYIPGTFIIQPPKPNKDFILYYAGIDKKNNNIVWIGGIHKKNYPLGNQLTTKKMLSVATKCRFDNKEYVRMIAKGKQFEEFNYDMDDFNERLDLNELYIFDGDKVDYSNMNIKFIISIGCINKDGTIVEGEEVGARAHIKLFDFRNIDQLKKEEDERIKNKKDNSGLN